MKNSPLNYGSKIHNPRSNLRSGIAGKKKLKNLNNHPS
jgi:hypothetical protein